MKKNIFFFFILSIFFIGCQSADESASCEKQLDNREFASVASNTACSTYMRASAELAMAGFMFETFLKDGASDNFRIALGIPDTVTSWTGTGDETPDIKVHYDKARRLSGNEEGDTYYVASSSTDVRSKEDIEIHYFATLGSLLAETYISLDPNADGQISDDENQAFTKIKNPPTGSNTFNVADWFQFIPSTGGDPILINPSRNECQPGNSNHDGIWSSSASTYGIEDEDCGLLSSSKIATIISQATGSTANYSISGECMVISKIDDIKELFTDTTNDMLRFTSSFISKVASIDNDLAGLGLEPDSDLRESLNDFTNSIDNGGDCNSSGSSSEIDKVLDLVDAGTKDVASNYSDKNKLLYTKIRSASDSDNTSASTTYSSSFTNSGITINLTFTCTGSYYQRSTRMIFASDSGYVANYGSAKTGIKNTFSSLRNIGFDANGREIPSVKGDNKVSLKELQCFN